MEKKILLGKYKTGALLGKGTFAKVHVAEHITTGEKVAIKVIKKDQVKCSEMMEQITREISVMKLVRHPHIVELKEVMATKTKIFLVMEYVKGGELFAKVAKGRLTETAARKYFQQLISAVDFCHSNGVIHRDLKPENLLLDESQKLKVSDFGLSALPEQLANDGLLKTQCGTPAYIAPEVLRNKGYDGTLADIWSCGIILYVLLAGFLPFQADSLIKMYRKVIKCDYKFPPWFSTESKRLISKILVPIPEKRVTMNEIISDPWFRKDFEMPDAFSIEDHHMMFHRYGPSPEIRRGMMRSPGMRSPGMIKSPSSPALLNAFEFISSMSSGVDLSALFENKKKTETTFTSRCSATIIMAKIQLMARRLNFRVARINGAKLKLQGPSEGRKGRLLVTSEVFKVASEVAVVKFCKVSGDSIEYTNFVEEEVRPSLKDIICSWHGEKIAPKCESSRPTPNDMHRELSFDELVVMDAAHAQPPYQSFP
ncbi:hypothetical protein Leryth_019170 [Lithospermum erythrorhizon]|nr:hypothetical protein Leryth_019170 [Lithospermum erythrorhizon]